MEYRVLIDETLSIHSVQDAAILELKGERGLGGLAHSALQSKNAACALQFNSKVLPFLLEKSCTNKQVTISLS